ncbi:bacteriocin-like protein [Chryseobacterium oryctis]|uniref:Bacteriocin-type signal sequence-containing protein n=1 Tax=Chryseobacterium oryctis TaxID=2952618 RepID=A0ABT3HJ56_9FLAO|nr:hypothetical protein [Chryseobacterium oryctis]MCW3159811.1 hypothetical protein [Chryseobacterium oryctis]
MKNLKKLTRKELVNISGGDTAYAFCDESGVCPPTFPSSASTYCSNGICYRVTSGGGSGGGGCNEPQRLCQPWETGCGCVY